jgi:hypothetical protein
MTISMNTRIIVKFQNRCDNEEDICNIYIDVENPDEDIKNQQYPEEIVIPMKKIQIKYEYPLLKSKIFEYEAKNEFGFTRAELAEKVCEGYQKIYNHEIGMPGDPAAKDADSAIYEIQGVNIRELLLYEVWQKKRKFI